MSVDLPAPFSPTIPWIVPARTERDTSRLAWTAPNHLSIPRSSIAVDAALSMFGSGRQLRRPAAPSEGYLYSVTRILPAMMSARACARRRSISGVIRLRLCWSTAYPTPPSATPRLRTPGFHVPSRAVLKAS